MTDKEFYNLPPEIRAILEALPESGANSYEDLRKANEKANALGWEIDYDLTGEVVTVYQLAGSDGETRPTYAIVNVWDGEGYIDSAVTYCYDEIDRQKGLEIAMNKVMEMVKGFNNPVIKPILENASSGGSYENDGVQYTLYRHDDKEEGQDNGAIYIVPLKPDTVGIVLYPDTCDYKEMNQSEWDKEIAEARQECHEEDKDLNNCIHTSYGALIFQPIIN